MTSQKESQKGCLGHLDELASVPHSPVGNTTVVFSGREAGVGQDASVDGACWRSSGARPRWVGKVHGADGRWVPTMPSRDGLRTLLRSLHRPHVGETCCAQRTRLNS